MPNEINPSDEKHRSELNPDVKNTPERVEEEAEKAKEDIAKEAADFRANEGIENPDLVLEADRAATDSKEEINHVLQTGTERVADQEVRNFNYAGANDWIELYSMIGQNMSAADSEMVIDHIKAFRDGKITEKDLPVTPDSHLKEVVAKLQKRDNLMKEEPSQANPEVAAAAVVEKPVVDVEPIVVENRHDVRDARTKGSINRLRALLDDMNIAIQKSDRTLQQRSLEEAAVLLNEPRLAAQSTELSQALEQAQISAENKIRDLEKEIQVAQLERLIAPLKDLITKINGAKTREDKLNALQEAANLLNKPDLATAILQKSKDEQDLLVPDALEQAVLLAEAKIRKIEEEINKIKDSGTVPEPTPKPEPSPEPTPKPEPSPEPTPKPEPSPEPEKPEDFDNARSNYFELVKKRKKIFSRNRKVLVGGYKEEAQDELEKAHDDYENLKQAAIIKILENMKKNGETDPEKLAAAYIKFLQEEEQRVDALSSAGDASTLNKFKSWWKKHWKDRLAIAGGMFVLGAGATAISGGLLGPAVASIVGSTMFGTSFVAARGIMSGTGTYMGSETLMDIKTKKLGQKGLIDTIEGSDFYKIDNKDNAAKRKERFILFKANAGKCTLQDIGAELARLRSMGLEKGTSAAEAGRYGKSQSEVVKALEEIYYSKLREKVLAESAKKPEENKKDEQSAEQDDRALQADRILAALRQKSEDERAEQLLPEVDKYRKKSMIRHGVAIGLGVGMGLFSSHMAEKTAARLAGGDTVPAQEVAAAATVQQAAEKHVDYNVEVKAGDSLWKIISSKLQETMGSEKWNALGEAGQTHAIDSVKDAVGANPEAFGMHDIDQLVPGQHIDLSGVLGQPDAIEKLQHGVEAMQAAGGEANILANNDALEAAAKAGVRLTTENVDAVAHEVREHGTGFLSPDGVVHEWTLNGQAVDRLADGSFVTVDSHQAVSPDQLANVFNHARENAQSLVEAEAATKAASEAAAETANQAAQAAEQSANVEKFLSTGGNYSHDVFEAAKNSGQLESVVSKVVESGDQNQIASLIKDYASDQGWSEQKTNIFMAALQHGDKVDLTASGHFDLHDPQVLAQNMEAFEKTALTNFDQVKHMPAGQWIHARLGDSYALVQKYHTGIWPWRADHFLMDTNGDHAADVLKMDDESMKQAFTKSLEASKRMAAALASKIPFGPHPPMAK